ncbi:Neuroblast differentiation-associated protein AHNAK [Frankliniella fusca]|uniref:Neuroblast differentiation-associated protein AHNAK n=1 Tax=Frankliniella fusca TaxID=407009 RepID=A0AAE1HZ53_9NEOP|nr:Neuroblast differentiation-associated protein AHNAK [Frankliniella fusca]
MAAAGQRGGSAAAASQSSEGLAAGLLVCVVVGAWGAAGAATPASRTHDDSTTESSASPPAEENSSSVTEPTSGVTGPTITAAGPTSSVTGPTITAAGPTGSVTRSTVTAAGPTGSVTRPTAITAAGTTGSVTGPTITAAATTGSVTGPTITAAATTGSVTRPTTITADGTTGSVTGPTITAAATTGSVTGPTITAAATTGSVTGPTINAAGKTGSVTGLTSRVTEPPPTIGSDTTSPSASTGPTSGPTGNTSDQATPEEAVDSTAAKQTTSALPTAESEATGQTADSASNVVQTGDLRPTDDRQTHDADDLTTDTAEPTTNSQRSPSDESSTAGEATVDLSVPPSSSTDNNASSPLQLEIVIEESTEVDAEQGATDEPASTKAEIRTTPSSPSTSTADEHPAPDLADKDSRDLEDAYHNEVPDEVRRKYKLSHPFLIGTRTAAKDESSSTSSSPSSGRSFVLYRNYDVDSQERERELEERGREQNHPADLEDTNVHEVNHYVPGDEHEDDPEEADKVQQQQQRSVARWYLLLLAGNSTTVRLRQKDFAKYLKLNLAARLSVEYNDLRVNRVEFKPLLMVNVTIFSRPKDNEEAPLHMLADTNATLLELSGEEYHVVRFITIPNDEALASLASGGFQADSYTGTVPRGDWHVDMGVAVYFAIAAALVSILLAVFLVGLWRYVRALAAEVRWPWRRYKPYSLPRWSLPLQHRLCADHIVHCAPLRSERAPHEPLGLGRRVWTTADAPDADVPVQKILAPEPAPPHRLVLTASLPHLLAGEAAPSTADTLLQTQPGPPPPPPAAPAAPAAAGPGPSRPNSKLSLFGAHCEQVLQPERPPLLGPAAPASRGRHRLQPQGRHPLDVRIGPTVLGLDNPNYMLQ